MNFATRTRGLILVYQWVCFTRFYR